MPKNSWLTTLIVHKKHSKVMHGRTVSTLAKVGSNYWIRKGRQSIKKISKSYIICRKYLARPGDQLTAPLPPDQPHQTPVFSFCSLDFAGPLCVRNSCELKKSYILLFTCCVLSTAPIISPGHVNKFPSSCIQMIPQKKRKFQSNL